VTGLQIGPISSDLVAAVVMRPIERASGAR
jgi:hypothetical protein